MKMFYTEDKLSSASFATNQNILVNFINSSRSIGNEDDL